MHFIKISKSWRKKLERYIMVYAGIVLWIYQPGISGVSAGEKCGRPGRTASSTYAPSGKSFNENDVIYYKCEGDHVLLGASERRCLRNGSWSGEIPVCSKIAEFKRIEVMSEGVHLNLSKSVDRNISTCTEMSQFYGIEWKGYLSSATHITEVHITVLGTDDGNMDVKIQEDTYKEKQCVIKRTILETVAESTKTVIFSCPAGTVGNTVVITYSYHAFSICEVSVLLPTVRQCLTPDIPLHGTGYQRVSTKVTTYEFRCNPGYKRWGAFQVFCETGTWQPKSPVCDEIYCDAPDNIPNGYVEYDSSNFRGVPYNTTAKYSCKEGYILEGPSIIICHRWNAWDSEPPKCILKTTNKSTATVSSFTSPLVPFLTESTTKTTDIYCDAPDNIPNGYVEYDSSNIRGVPYNSTAKYSCKEGYILEGQSTIICHRWNAWDSEPPKCILKTTNKSTVTVSSFNSPLVPFLTESTTKTTEDSCGTFHVISERQGEWKSLDGSSSFLVLICPENFHIEGSPAVIQCLPNGSWSYSPAVCEKSVEKSWGSNWSPSLILIVAIAAGAGTAIFILCLSVVFLVVKKRLQTRTNTTVFHLENTHKNSSTENIHRLRHHSVTDNYESVIERRSKSASINSRKPRSALPNLPLDTDPVYAQPFETSATTEKLSSATVNRKEDLYNTHIYAEPVDSRKPPQSKIPPNICAPRTVTDSRESVVKTNFGSEQPLSVSTDAPNCARKCAIYDSSDNSRQSNSVRTNEVYHSTELGKLPKNIEYLELL